MKKSVQASVASVNLANSIVDNDLSASFVEAVAKAPKAPKAKVEAPVVVEPVAVALTDREIAVVKAIASSEYSDPESGAVPSFSLAIDPVVANGVNKVNSPVPGILASLKKKGVVESFKVKGLSLVKFSEVGKEFAESLV